MAYLSRFSSPMISVPTFPLIEGNWYDNTKFALDVDGNWEIDEEALFDIAGNETSSNAMRASILGKNYVYKWLRDSDAVEGPRLDFTGHVGDITLFGSRDRVFNLPPSQLFDTVQVRFGDWRTAFNSKGVESVPFLMSKTTFCLSDSPQYSVHLVWEPIEVPLQAYSRDECQKATADGALSLVEANAVANFIAGLLYI